MPGRKIPLVTGEIYHVLNRGITSQLTYIDKRDCQRFIQTMFYYQNTSRLVKYSRFIRFSQSQRQEFMENFKGKNFLVEIIAFCLMPNHFHLLLKQTKDKGISQFMSNLANSYTRYFNTKQDRGGPLFQDKFKAVFIENEEQFLHVGRYIHLNPFSSHVAKNLNDLEKYPFSSLPEYLNPGENDFCAKSIILDQFTRPLSYKKFVFDQADYQRKLEEIKHLVLEKP